MTLWLAVTTDEYELPIAVADSVIELAKMVGVSENAIYQTVRNHKVGKVKKKVCPYMKIKVY